MGASIRNRFYFLSARLVGRAPSFFASAKIVFSRRTMELFMRKGKSFPIASVIQITPQTSSQNAHDLLHTRPF